METQACIFMREYRQSKHYFFLTPFSVCSFKFEFLFEHMLLTFPLIFLSTFYSVNTILLYFHQLLQFFSVRKTQWTLNACAEFKTDFPLLQRTTSCDSLSLRQREVAGISFPIASALQVQLDGCLMGLSLPLRGSEQNSPVLIKSSIFLAQVGQAER